MNKAKLIKELKKKFKNVMYVSKTSIPNVAKVMIGTKTYKVRHIIREGDYQDIMVNIGESAFEKSKFNDMMQNRISVKDYITSSRSWIWDNDCDIILYSWPNDTKFVAHSILSKYIEDNIRNIRTREVSTDKKLKTVILIPKTNSLFR